MGDRQPASVESFVRQGPSIDGIRGVTHRNFLQLVLNAQGPVAVEFMTYGCIHCRVIEPVLQQVAEAVKSKVTIFRVNIAVERSLAEEYEIQGTPTFIMFLNGAEVDRVEGPRPTFSSVLTMATHPFHLDGEAASEDA
jgi:thioredoxin 1